LVAPQLPDGGEWYSDPDDLTMDILWQVITTSAVDERRIYCTGLSLGGYGTVDRALNHPRLLAAIVPMSGARMDGEPPPDHPIRALPAWLFHGSDDNSAAPVEQSRTYYRYITGSSNIVFNATNYGYTTASEWPVRYTELAGEGHVIWDPIYDHVDTDLYDWMFAQVRPSPDEIRVELEYTGSNLVLSATNDTPFAKAFLRTASTLLGPPVTNWPAIDTNWFDIDGAVTFTISGPSNQHFYAITSP